MITFSVNGHTVTVLSEPDIPLLAADAKPSGAAAATQIDDAADTIDKPGVPPIGPAVANAWRALTGKAVRQLPFTFQPRAARANSA